MLKNVESAKEQAASVQRTIISIFI